MVNDNLVIEVGIIEEMHMFGYLYADQGKLDEAETMYERALRGYENALGLEHVITYIRALTAMHNLAKLLSSVGRTSESRDLYTRAQAGIEIVFGRASSRYEVVEALARLSVNEAS
ncbi:hypothetical protein AA0119_g12108 [Alternaria tenuissima]|uniref:MalT-like TPR region domain-containing protein n=1 Tax=Alternaria tenuissima TaxID=119927 RepID=A0ABY0FU45_9PLEO|nr:hypothetical protein AA0120_g12211 [Alternaria tenuissima]RYN88173.1 hypothetical protein AA0119_g12108 [Alternaria tenuissima]RYO05992.1 hypothetical protein AA0121_g12213 [Alternaria tenuissima]